MTLNNFQWSPGLFRYKMLRFFSLLKLTFDTAGPWPEIITISDEFREFIQGAIKFLSLLPPLICIQQFLSRRTLYSSFSLIVSFGTIWGGMWVIMSLCMKSSCSKFLPWNKMKLSINVGQRCHIPLVCITRPKWIMW